MTSGSESQQEAVAVKLRSLCTKTKTRIGFLNVRTMFSTGRLAQVTKEMNENKLHFLGIGEYRWTRFGTQITRTGETILFSGRNDNLHRQGVAFILKKGVEKSLLDRKPINERLIRARFFRKQVRMTVIQCYDPTNDADSKQKDTFSETLQPNL